MGRMTDRVALITGAGGAMGATIAQRFAGEGALLVLTDISQRRLSATVVMLVYVFKWFETDGLIS